MYSLKKYEEATEKERLLLISTVNPLLKGHNNERPTPLERPLGNNGWLVDCVLRPIDSEVI